MPPPPGETIPDKRTVKIVNLTSPAPVIACYRRQGSGNAFTAFGFRESGIPKDAMSARILFEYNDTGQAEVIVVAASSGCTGESLGTTALALTTQAENLHYDLVLTDAGLETNFEHLTPTEGKESIMIQAPASNPTFTPDGGEPIMLRKISFEADLLDPDVVGTLKRPGFADYTRPFKTQAGGTLSVFATADGLLVCDERAASADGLTPCPASLRAP